MSPSKALLMQGRKKRVKRKKRLPSRDEQREELQLLETVKRRYGTKKTHPDEFKEPMFHSGSGQVVHPAGYQRMMARSIEAHLNRMLQPEPPADLVASNWLCALCQRRSGAEGLGELFGPYFVRLSAQCQPPLALVPRQVREAQRSNCEPAVTMDTPSTSKAVVSFKKAEGLPVLYGCLDVWLHGQCALWTPELFLVGGRLPTLQLHIQRYWEQKCSFCGGPGATVPVARPHFAVHSPNPQRGRSGRRPSRDESKRQYLHFDCAERNGYRPDPLTLICRPPLSRPTENSD